MPSIRFRLNGVETAVDADPGSSLLDILRGRLCMTGTHFGCGANECGACNILVGDFAVAACDTPLWSVADKDITSAAALLRQNPNPADKDVRAALDRNLCRCGSHNRIVKAVLRAALESVSKS